MTCIAWDGKVLAGDRMRSMYNTPTLARKVARVRSKDGRVFLVGASGESEDCVAFMRWMKQKGDKPTVTNLGAIVIDERLRIWCINEKLVYLQLRGHKFWSVGCGADYAMGAMACGESAAGAVRIASRFDTRCGRGVDVVRF